MKSEGVFQAESVEGTMATGQEHVWNTQEEYTRRLVWQAERARASWQRRPERFEEQVGLKEGEGRGLADGAGAEEVVRNPIIARCEQFADELEMMVMDDGTVSSG